MRVTWFCFNWVETLLRKKMTKSLILNCLVGAFSEGGTLLSFPSSLLLLHPFIHHSYFFFLSFYTFLFINTHLLAAWDEPCAIIVGCWHLGQEQSQEELSTGVVQSYKSEIFSCLYTSHLDKANCPKPALRQTLKLGVGHPVLNVIVLSLCKETV